MTPEKLGRYEILGELGKGAMGVVYLARDPIIDRQLAIKTFRMAYSAREKEVEQFRQRFLREAQTVGKLSHPNIVTVHDVGQEDDEYFIAMEYIKGVDLKQQMLREERLDVAYVVDVVAQIAEGLAAAHHQGVVHRDVKPANIIITAENQAKITDFGIARIEQSNLTVAGQLLGTPNYMAPEQIQGKEVDSRTDIFSLGVMLYELLTKKKPFQGENLTQVSHRIVYDEYTSPGEFVDDLPPKLLEILERALSKDPDDRYQDAGEMARDLRDAMRKDGETSGAALESSPPSTGPVQVSAPEPPAEAADTAEIPAPLPAVPPPTAPSPPAAAPTPPAAVPSPPAVPVDPDAATVRTPRPQVPPAPPAETPEALSESPPKAASEDAGTAEVLSPVEEFEPLPPPAQDSGDLDSGDLDSGDLGSGDLQPPPPPRPGSGALPPPPPTPAHLVGQKTIPTGQMAASPAEIAAAAKAETAKADAAKAETAKADAAKAETAKADAAKADAAKADAARAKAPAKRPPAKEADVSQHRKALGALLVLLVVALGVALLYLGWAWSRSRVTTAEAPPGPPPPSPTRSEAALLAEAQRLAGEATLGSALTYLQNACEKELCGRKVLLYYLELADQADAEDDVVEAYVAERMAVVETYLQTKKYEQALAVLELILLADPEHVVAEQKAEDIERLLGRRRQPRDQPGSRRSSQQAAPPTGSTQQTAPPAQRTGELKIVFRTLVAEGHVKVIANATTVFDRSFDFPNRKFFARKKLKNEEKIEGSLPFDAGAVQFRVEVRLELKDGPKSLSRELGGVRIPADATGTLRISVSEDGEPTLHFE